MSFRYDITEIDAHLLVTSRGVQNTLTESLAYIKTIVDTCRNRNLALVLLDEREVAYRETMLDTHIMVEFLTEKLKEFPVKKIACVPAKRYYSQVRDFETLMRNKSLNYKTFRDMELARAWLLDHGASPGGSGY
ncbi:MAG: hypothetical protein EPN93_12075 [Spirochaetes bacterium]|nr:MAG: hypothetical protein EPN93_12075 [Spirochaetota bacterium]